MKPTTLTNKDARKFPLVDYHYQASSLAKLTSRGAKTSFRDISRDYFETEANEDFLSNAAIFGALLASAIVPILAGASAIVELCRSLPLF
jgi:hypothetical protein